MAKSLKDYSRKPVIAVRVSEKLHQKIKRDAKKNNRSMSEEMAIKLAADGEEVHVTLARIADVIEHLYQFEIKKKETSR